MGRLPMFHRWLRRQWPTSRTPEVVDTPFSLLFYRHTPKVLFLSEVFLNGGACYSIFQVDTLPSRATDTP